MKTYAELNEAISAARLAQLKAKGKGDAASAKMKADNLSSSKVSSTATSSARKALPSSNGGALVKRSSQGSSITKRDTGKSGGLVRKTFTKPSSTKAKSVPDEKQVGKTPGTSRASDDWGKEIPDWEGDSGSKVKAKKKNDNKDKKELCSGKWAKRFNPLCNQGGGTLGTGDDGRTVEKERENSKI